MISIIYKHFKPDLGLVIITLIIKIFDIDALFAGLFDMNRHILGLIFA